MKNIVILISGGGSNMAAIVRTAQRERWADTLGARVVAVISNRPGAAGLGLARDEAMSETEDHVAYVSEVMRYLIAGDDMAVCNLTQQQVFFSQHLQPWLPAMCDAVAQHPDAHFYRALATFTAAFIQVEAQGFDMLD